MKQEPKKIDLGLKEAYEELFMTQEQRDDKRREKIIDLPLDELQPFQNHPFRVTQDGEMNELLRSIHERGIISPCLVRPKPEGGYEIISGHRRKAACEMLGWDTIPAIVREMDDDTAVITMVDSNQQRENLLPSEKAFAYKMKLEALKRKAGRPKNNSCQVGTNFRADNYLAEEADESARNIQRYIRLTNLTPDLMKLVDDGCVALTPAVELSYLPEELQEALLDACGMQDCTPSLSQAVKLRRMAQEGTLTPRKIQDIMREPKANQRDRLTFRADTFAQFFPKSYTVEQMEQEILRLLKQRQERSRDRDAR